MTREDRRRQLLGIGLRKFVERPVQEISVDEVAAEAGISRGLLFHYFPTKTDFFKEVVHAAGRRVLRNLAPDEDVTSDVALAQVIEKFIRQIERRRDSYVALVYGQSAVFEHGEGAASSLREAIATTVITALALDPARLPVVHAWVAYVEDRALLWSELPEADRTVVLADLVSHCAAALPALLALP